MPEVHVPQVEDDEDAAPETATNTREADPRQSASPAVHRSKSLMKIGLDVILISAGVFLGQMGEQWREHAQHREVARDSLQRLRTEILTNRKAVVAVEEYHVTTGATLERYFAAGPQERRMLDVPLHGLQPVFFEHTAWDLAVVTQSLAYTDPPLAVALSRAYTLQQEYADLTRSVMQAMYVRPPTENADAFLGAVKVYYGDVVLWEPALLGIYDRLIPQIDGALGNGNASSGSMNPAGGDR